MTGPLFIALIYYSPQIARMPVVLPYRWDPGLTVTVTL